FSEYIHRKTLLLVNKYIGMIERVIQRKIGDRLFKGKTILVIGARQVGKTTLVKELLSKKNFLFLDGDDPLVRERLTNPNTQEIAAIIGKHEIVFIDEAQ